MTDIILAVALVAGIGLLAGIGLGIANAVMAVKENETAVKLLSVLPGANCGACSFSGCKGYAEALSGGKVKTNLCVVGGADVAKKVAEILGTEAAETEQKAAMVFCHGTNDCVSKTYVYNGIKTCKAASAFFGGDSACRYGCLGFGDCQSVCEFGGISICNGVAVINTSSCVACGKCAAACPKKIISIVPKKYAAAALCSNPDKGPATRKVCSAGCIGCRMCEKACEYGAISFNGFRAVIDRNKCVGCGKCAEACKFGCIVITGAKSEQ